MTIESLLAERRSRLTATERRLADVIAADPARAARASAAALAAEAGAHGASAVRLARKLGFAGFPELRAALHDEAYAALGTARRLRQRLDRLPQQGLLAGLAHQEAELLTALPAHVSEAALEDAARRLAGAPRVVVAGEGGGRLLADLLADRLGRLGRTVESAPHTPRALARALSGARAGDVLAAVALTRAPAALVRAMAAARRDGLSVVLIADPELQAAAAEADVALLAPRGPAEATRTLLAPLAVVSALQLAVSRQLGEQGLAAARRYGALRATLAGRAA